MLLLEYLEDLQELGWDVNFRRGAIFESGLVGEQRIRIQEEEKEEKDTEPKQDKAEDQKPAEVPFAVQPAALLTVTVESVESSAVTQHAVLRKQHPKRMRRPR